MISLTLGNKSFKIRLNTPKIIMNCTSKRELQLIRNVEALCNLKNQGDLVEIASPQVKLTPTMPQ